MFLIWLIANCEDKVESVCEGENVSPPNSLSQM